MKFFSGQRVVHLRTGQFLTIVEVSGPGAMCRPDGYNAVMVPYPLADLRPVEPRDNDTGGAP